MRMSRLNVLALIMLASGCGSGGSVVAPVAASPTPVSREMALTLAVTASPSPQPLKIKSAQTMCLDINQVSHVPGTQLQSYGCNGGSNQAFAFTAAGELRAYSGTMCIDDFNAKGVNGDMIVVYTCNGGKNQQWHQDSNGQIIGINNRCISLSGGGTTQGTKAILWDCHLGPDQEFLPIPSGGSVVTSPSPSPSPSVKPSTVPSPSPSPSAQPSSTPSAAIYAVNAAGSFALAASVTGQAPLSVHVAAIPTHADPCLFDQAGWEAAGMKNLCSVNWQAWSLPATIPTKSFVNNGAAGAVNADTACFHNFLDGKPTDAATTQAINQIAACVSAAANKAYGASVVSQTFNWDFGDPGTPYDAVRGYNAAHVYYKPGTYKVTMNGKTLTVNVTANTRTPLLINTQADMDALASVGNLGKVNGQWVSNRWIQLKRGMTFNLSKSIYLYANDWLTAQPGTGALPIITNNTGATVTAISQAGPSFGNVLVELVDIEGIGTAAATHPYISQITGGSHHVVFKDIVFHNVHKAFDLAGTGILIQNVGSAKPWVDTQLNSNFAIMTLTGGAFYGNNVYVAQSAYNGEPGLRSNGGQLVSVVGNNFGGWIGKYDWVSVRGAQNYYFGSNTVRGGLINTQNGVGQDPFPSAIYMNGVFENNTIDNCNLALQQGSQNTRINGNTFIFRDRPAGDLYVLAYPPQQGWSLGFSGASFGIQTSNTTVSNNTFYGLLTQPKMGGEIVWMGDQANTTFTGNTFWSANFAPIYVASSLAAPKYSGNTFYVNKLTDVPAATAAGNTVKLNTAMKPTVPAEQLPTPPPVAPSPTPTAAK